MYGVRRVLTIMRGLRLAGPATEGLKALCRKSVPERQMQEVTLLIVVVGTAIC